IISDSLLFKSPTCTGEDVDAALELAKIADVDAQVYGLEMLKAGADLSSKTVEQLISLDAKEFQMGGSKVVIAQVNSVDTNDVLSRQQELETVITQTIEQKSLDLFLLVVTNILTSDSVALALGNAQNAVEKAYNVTLENNTALLKGVVSRKKQVVPVLTAQFN
ncbi:MAG: manganese-dependent inorganic pyrophosphatase, partial [Bacillota bacterium]|nr:manganese-dependent inorganic pyrophosphatase [Bacillota bacterium]